MNEFYCTIENFFGIPGATDRDFGQITLSATYRPDSSGPVGPSFFTIGRRGLFAATLNDPALHSAFLNKLRELVGISDLEVTSLSLIIGISPVIIDENNNRNGRLRMASSPAVDYIYPYPDEVALRYTVDASGFSVSRTHTIEIDSTPNSVIRTWQDFNTFISSIGFQFLQATQFGTDGNLDTLQPLSDLKTPVINCTSIPSGDTSSTSIITQTPTSIRVVNNIIRPRELEINIDSQITLELVKRGYPRSTDWASVIRGGVLNEIFTEEELNAFIESFAVDPAPSGGDKIIADFSSVINRLDALEE